MPCSNESALRRSSLAFCVVLLLSALGATCDRGPRPVPGSPGYRIDSLIRVPGGVVDVASASLLIAQTDLTLDTQVGPRSIGLVWSSADRLWRWSFDVRFDGSVFVDALGTRWEVGGLEPGDPIPGSTWIHVSSRELRTRGGLVHRFDPLTGGLVEVRWSGYSWPRIRIERAESAGAQRVSAIVQQRSGGAVDRLFEIERDPAGRVTAVHDLAGRAAHFEYDDEGRLTTFRGAADVEAHRPGRRFEYDRDLVVAMDGSDGVRVEYRYRNGRPVAAELIGEEHPTDRFYWGSVIGGRYLVVHTDALGHDWRYELDVEGRLQWRANPVGDVVEMEWDGLRPISRIEPDGRTTRWAWEGDEVVLRVTPGGNRIVTSYAENALNRVAPHARAIRRVDDELGLVEERHYASSGELEWRVNGEGDEWRYAYHEDGHLYTVEHPGGRKEGYWNHGHHGHAGWIDLNGGTYDLEFAATGDRLHGDDPFGPLAPATGGAERIRYDADRRPTGYLLSTQEDLFQSGERLWLEASYRGDGRLSRIERPYGGDTRWTFDAVGRLTSRRDRADGAWHVTTIETDGLGRTLSVTRPNGMGQEWEYDAAGRVVRRTILRDGVVESEEVRRYELGRLVEIRQPGRLGAEQIVYDAAGHPVIVVFPDGEQLWRRFDLRSRTIEERFVMPSLALLATIERTWDLANRERTLVRDGLVLVERTYESGRLAVSRYANGIEEIHEYGERYGQIEYTELIHEGAHVAETRYRRSTTDLPCPARYCIQKLTGSQWIPEDLDWGEELYHVGQIEKEGVRVGRRLLVSRETDSDVAWMAMHQFDHLSNRSGFTCIGALVPYVRAVYNDERNRLQRIEAPPECAERSHTYRWDEAGFAVERDGVSLSWDGAGRIRSIGDRADFEWDPTGRPVFRRLDATLTRFRFGGQVEADANGTPTALNSPEVRIRLDDGGHRFRHFDWRGNVQFVTDENGDLVRHYLYRAYGVRVEYGDDDDPYDFARGLRAGSLVILGHRLLDPDAAAFLAPDPIYQLINQHAYSLGNPVALWDPDGRHPRPAAPPANTPARVGWSIAYTGAAILGGVVGAKAGPVGLIAGPVIGVAIVNHLYQTSTGEQGVGPEEAVEYFNPVLQPRATSRDVRGEAEQSSGPESVSRANAASAPRKEGGDTTPIDYPIGTAQVSCGLGFESALAVSAVALVRRVRRRPGRRER